MLQQLLCLHDLYLQLLRHYELYCRNHYYATKAIYYSNYQISRIYIHSFDVAILYLNTNIYIQLRSITTIMQQAMMTACPLLEDPADARTRSG